MTWQSIDTAPKDGAWILLAGGELDDQRHDIDDFGKHPVVARWDVEWRTGRWFVSDFDDGYGLGIAYNNPTCWMPIEPLPADMVAA